MDGETRTASPGRGCFIALFAIGILTGCATFNTDPWSPDTVEPLIRQVIHTHVLALSARQIDAVMATLHPDAKGPAGRLDRKAVESNAQSGLRYELVSVSCLGVDAPHAFALVVTRRTDDATHRSELRMLHILKKDKAGKWLIWQVTPLGSGPLPSLSPPGEAHAR
jgi:ketosteroid isomerase-like protein